MSTAAEIDIAGISWPMYKVAALILGVVVLVAVGVTAAATGPAVLSAAAAASAVWLAGGLSARRVTRR